MCTCCLLEQIQWNFCSFFIWGHWVCMMLNKTELPHRKCGWSRWMVWNWLVRERFSMWNFPKEWFLGVWMWQLKKEPRKKIARKRLALVGLNFGKQLLTYPSENKKVLCILVNLKSTSTVLLLNILSILRDNYFKTMGFVFNILFLQGWYWWLTKEKQYTICLLWPSFIYLICRCWKCMHYVKCLFCIFEFFN